MRPLLGSGMVNTCLWQQIHTQHRTVGSAVFFVVSAEVYNENLRSCCLQHLLLHNVTAYMTCLLCVYGSLPSNSHFFASTVLTFNKYATILTW